jgi:hypothetical protein
VNVDVIYCFPQVEIRTYYALAVRFADTYRQFRPTTPHTLRVGLNGGDPNLNFVKQPFHDIDAQFHQHSNVGWDVGLFQDAAVRFPCDLMVFLGAPVHFHQPNWLEIMCEAYVNHGPALFGCWAYLSPNWHVRTTCFWCPPELVSTYPYLVGSTRPMRYQFEHGQNSLTRHAMSAGLDCIMVTRKGCFPFDQWQNHAPGLEDSLVCDQFTHR